MAEIIRRIFQQDTQDTMTNERLDEVGDAVRERARSRERAAEREALEAAGRNWSARHVADLLDLSELTVKRMARRGKLPAVKVGRGWMFPPAKVRAWYAGEAAKPVEPPGRKKKVSGA